VVDPHLLAAAAVLWVLTPTFIANAAATLPGGVGPPMDFGTVWSDGRRVLGASKTWSGYFVGILFAIPFGLLQAYLYGIAPESLRLVPGFGPSVAAAVPLVLLLTVGALTGDAIGSFVKRRLGRDSGSRTIFIDQLPFVLVPVVLGLWLFPSTFDPAFLSPEGILWLVLFTLGFHAAFNWVGYQVGQKKVPW
jgi:CDP-2,3-bis-(O-geranylgeranyl)-sn-glycerol synthase